VQHEVGFAANALGTLTPGSLVDLMLDEEIHHRDDGGEESELDHEQLTVNCELVNRRCGNVFSVDVSKLGCG